MGYPLQQLQATAHHIVNLFRYEDGQTLTKNEKKWAERELLQQLYNLSYIQKKVMLVDPSNEKLASYFKGLATDKIVFPVSHRFMLKVKGESYDKHIISRVSFAEQAQIVASRIAQECTSNRGALNAYQQEFTEQTIQGWLQEIKPHHRGTICIDAKNHGCDELLAELATQGVFFPQKNAYLMKPHGECLVKYGKKEELLCSPKTQTHLFYQHHPSKKIRKQMQSLSLLSCETLSQEDSHLTDAPPSPNALLWRFKQENEEGDAKSFGDNKQFTRRNTVQTV